MTVKQFWKKALGEFRTEDRISIELLRGKRVVVDTSAWVHQFDGKHDIQYARTSIPTYPHPGIINVFAARYAALVALGITPIFVFDGQSPTVKKRTNIQRQKKSTLAREIYNACLEEHHKAAIKTITDDDREAILGLRRDMARPTPEDYASISEWCETNDIEYVQAPFEADAQMKQIIVEQRASAAITEDGDLVIFGVPCILSQTKIDTLAPEKSTCQYFSINDLKAGKYKSPIEEGRRSEFLPEISCLLGNDYMNNLPNVGHATIFGTDRRKKGQTALIDSFINETVINKTKTEQQWLVDYMTVYGKKHEDDNNESSEEDWSPERFIKVRNLLKHYPIFAKNKETGEITLQPLNPLPKHVSYNEWGSYIGFDNHPSTYFTNNNYTDYYNMTIVASTKKPRSQHLGPRYTVSENPTVDTNTLLPLFGRLDFTQVPVEVQPMAVLRYHLLTRGVTTPGDISRSAVHNLVHGLPGTDRHVLDPTLVPEPDSWVGFEPLDDLEIGDKYDDWVSTYCYV